MTLVEQGQDAIVDGLDRACHEEAAGLAQPGQPIAVVEQVLHLDGHIVGQLRMRKVERLDNAKRVRRTVEEIWIAEREVLRARRDLGGNIGEHDLGLHDTELSVVNRHDRTVPAEMTTPAAGFGVADDPPFIAGEVKGRIPGDWRQA